MRVLQYGVLRLVVSAGEGLEVEGRVHLRPRAFWVMGSGSSMGVLEPHDDGQWDRPMLPGLWGGGRDGDA